MKLYTFPGAPNPRRVHVFLAEKGLDIPLEEVDLRRGANRAQSYLEKVDPTGRLPVLELDDGSHLGESVAICRYLEALHPDPPLFGTTAESVGRVAMWIRRIELDLMVPVGQVWMHGSPHTEGLVEHRIPELADRSRRAVARQYAFLDRELAGRPFLAGDAYTMADIVALTTIDFARDLNELPFDPERTRLAAWYERVACRPSARA